jgi:ABC-type nitrate/sulfonate/bicarbonate transport system substrate-binding protein
LAQKLLVGYFNAIKWLRDNPREAAEIFVELSELPVEEQEQVIKSITWLDEKDQQEKLGENGSLSQMLEFLADFLYENKQINNDVNVKEWINIESIPQ